MEKCLTPLPEVSNSSVKEVAGGELEKWPERLTTVPPRIKDLLGVTAEIFNSDTKLWAQRVLHYKKLDYQLSEPGRYRNLLDMNAHFGGFAAAMIDHPVWVMNVVPVEAELNTLGVIFERGLIGTYQNWYDHSSPKLLSAQNPISVNNSTSSFNSFVSFRCEAMSTYPRTYDFIHAASVFSLYNHR